MSDKSREELEERVDELEATVSKMLPSRRQAMKGMATAAGAGMLGFSAGNASAQASAEDNDGNVGNPDNPVDLFADGVKSNDVATTTASIDRGSAGDALIGPFHPGSLNTVVANGEHQGLAANIVENGDEWLLVWREAPEHGQNTNSVLKAADSPDNGGTWRNIRTIHDTGYDVRDQSTKVMDNGRIGIIACRSDGSNFVEPIFIYSDDGGSSWSSSVITGGTNGRVWRMYEYPGSVGGSDSGGYIAYGHDDNDIVYAETTDNGSNWSTSTAFTATPREVEPTVARIGTDDRWVMITRVQEDGSNASAYTSTDLTNWSGQTDTGQTLGKNPPTIAYYNGAIYWMAMSRGASIDGYDDVIVHQQADAEGIWSDPSAWNGWSVFSGGTNTNTGYAHFNEIDGRLVGTLAMGEGSGIDSSIGLLTPEPQVDRGYSFSGYGSDISGSRTRDNWYQNTDGSVKVVAVRTSDTSGGYEELRISVSHDQSLNLVQQQSDSGDGTNTTRVSVQAEVPPGYWYRVRGSSVSEWREGVKY